MIESVPHVCEVSHIPVAPHKSLVTLILSRAAGGEVALVAVRVQLTSTGIHYYGILRHYIY